MVKDWAEGSGFEGFVVFPCDDKGAAKLLLEVLNGGELEFVELLTRFQVKWPLVVQELFPLLLHCGSLVGYFVVVQPSSDGFESLCSVGGLGGVV